MRFCMDCGHPSVDHQWDGVIVRPARCRHEIYDGTDRGTILCGCEGWR